MDHKDPDERKALEGLWYVCRTHPVFGQLFENWMYADWAMWASTQAITKAAEFIKNEETKARNQLMQEFIEAYMALKELFRLLGRRNGLMGIFVQWFERKYRRAAIWRTT